MLQGDLAPAFTPCRQVTIEGWNSLSTAIQGLLRCTLVHDPVLRISSEDLMCHPFVK